MNTINFINPQQSSITYQTMVFPDGQPHLKIDTDTINHTSEQATIYTRIANPTDLLLVLMAKDLLYTLGLRRFSLHISYLMAARMDRSMTNGESFSLRVVAQLLNTAGFESIQVFDPHSDVAPALLQHGQAISNVGFAQTAIHHYRQQNPGLQHGQLCLVSPDAGALKKVLKLAAALGGMYVVECLKERDVNTGQLLGFKVFDENLAGKTCLIVDDICDGGGTFIGTAALLKAKGAAAVVLVVSHGIFSKGLPLAQVDAVYCTNSYRALASGQGLTVLEVMNYLG